jgi:uncharacterized protein (UPF0276 family)
MTGSAAIELGARWDDRRQDARIVKAREQGLLDYIEVNFPISAAEDPFALGLPVLAHTSNNPVASAAGLDPDVVEAVRVGAEIADSPWVGEHLSWLSENRRGALGYVLTPILLPEFVEHAVANIETLRAAYGRPIALELGPAYGMYGAFESEMHFLGEVARRADTGIILDITHWVISNRNLGRPEGWGLDALDLDRIVELHVAGMRASNSGTFWHDAHGVKLDDDVVELLKKLSRELPGVKAVTFEHSMEGSEADFLSDLARLRASI